ncbi:unnamed protein product [Adineta steineri]|uniref:DUF4097 domain-containing protein n=1 Tax=Adineta steineri TaxID=433720 RepID=A0A815JAN0_9BILA|nr:unnamed protein product [Adineta steineri]CAF1221130.1 unnamed protein product [Adineta steineri]CAF1293299.1 unnamed protein product [Adineta steineri]CAF1376614.1 unnamed protein product [Adineta steineri]CAF3516245.1 unnamed protein product [Adineta steineri]
MIFSSRAVFLPNNYHSKWFLNFLKQPWRCFGGLDTSPSSVMRNAEVQTIYSQTLTIPNQGRLEVRCPFNLYITPLHQKDFPRLDKAFFTIYGDSGFQFSKEVWNKLFQFSTVFSPDDRTLRVMGGFTEAGEKELGEQAHTLEVYCQIPPHYEVDINCSDNNNVNVEYLQSPRVHIQTKRGECSLKNIVADSIVVHSQSGNITCSGSLHGTIDLSTERDGIIKASKLQGPFVRLKVENSDIRAKSIHSEHFFIQGQHGKFRLGNLHGHGILDLNSGSIRIGSVDGDVSLQCEKGDVNVFFSSTNSSTIRVQHGDVRLGVIDTVSVRLNLVGKRVQVDEDAEHFHMNTTKQGGIVQVQGFITEESSGSSIDVNAPKGTIQLDVRDWFSTLKLHRHVDQ